MLPVVSAVWSAGETVSLAYPARYLFTFLDHHGMLVGRRLAALAHRRRRLAQLRRARPSKELSGGRTCRPRCARVTRTADGVEIRDDADAVHRADRVVVATHPDQALRLLADADRAPSARCSARSRYSRNETLLHTDTSVLPRRPRRAGVVELPQARLLVARTRRCSSATT